MTIELGTCVGLGLPGLAAFGWALYAGGQSLVLRSRGRARRELGHAFAQFGHFAWQLRDGVELQVRIEEIERGDQIIVRTGDVVPVDGRVVSGRFDGDSRVLTGETRPEEYQVGDVVLATTVVLSGFAVVHAVRSGSETVAARVEALIARTWSYEQRLQSRATHEAERSVRPTLATAGVGLLAYGPAGLLAGLWTNSVDSTWLASPYSMIATMRVAALGAIVVKDGRSLEQLSGVDVVVISDTAAVSSGEFDVVGIHDSDGREDVLLGLAAAVLSMVDSPLARALDTAARQRKVAIPAVEREAVVDADGHHAYLDGSTVVVGGRHLMSNEGVRIRPGLAREGLALEAAGRTVIHVAVNGEHRGLVALAPRLRSNAREIVDGLRARGLELVIVSGGAMASTAGLARALGVTRVHAGASAETRADLVAALQVDGRRVLYLGDGPYDALAMVGAHVSVATRGAAPITVECAQILLLTDSPRRFDLLLEFAAGFASDQRRIIDTGRIVTTVSALGLMFVGVRLPMLVMISAGAFALSMAAAASPWVRMLGRAPRALAFPPELAT